MDSCQVLCCTPLGQLLLPHELVVNFSHLAARLQEIFSFAYPHILQGQVLEHIHVSLDFGNQIIIIKWAQIKPKEGIGCVHYCFRVTVATIVTVT